MAERTKTQTEQGAGAGRCCGGSKKQKASEKKPAGKQPTGSHPKR